MTYEVIQYQLKIGSEDTLRVTIDNDLLPTGSAGEYDINFLIYQTTTQTLPNIQKLDEEIVMVNSTTFDVDITIEDFANVTEGDFYWFLRFVGHGKTIFYPTPPKTGHIIFIK
ncbi:MAG: hypothetical protein WC346_06385 [Methanogenium sp.]|jgi:hypothetical protein